MSIANALAQHWDRWFAPLIIVLLLGSLGWPAIQDQLARKQVAAASVADIGSRAMQIACLDGTYATKRTPRDLGVPGSDPNAYVSRTEIAQTSENAFRLSLITDERYKRGPSDPLDPESKSQGARLDFQFTCSKEKKFTSTLLRASTVKWNDVPHALRNDRI